MTQMNTEADTTKNARSVQPDRVSTDRGSPLQNKSKTETGGPAGLEPTRYGDWEKNGRCIDF
jgi:hypothetical protein